MVPGYDARQTRTTLAGLTKPDPKERAAQIVAWAICWPWNLVWTLCVYNPFRYVGEFLLRELQSALFEISNGQFRAIEQDLTLEPLPPPYPACEADSRYGNSAVPQTSVEASNVAAKQAGEVDSSVSQAAAAEEAKAEAFADCSAVIESATVGVVAVADQSAPAAQPDEVDVAAKGVANKEVAAEAADETTIEDVPSEDGIPSEIEAMFEEAGSSDSYTWEPPEVTAFVPLSDRPLRAIKYDTGTTLPKKPVEPNRPVSDPWFEKHAPNQ